MDVLKDDAFTNLIVLQTVLQELRHRHAPGYNTIREILANKDRQFFVFTNEHHKYVLNLILFTSPFTKRPFSKVRASYRPAIV